MSYQARQNVGETGTRTIKEKGVVINLALKFQLLLACCLCVWNNIYILFFSGNHIYIPRAHR